MKDKKTLFLLPGFLCDERVWQEQVSALAPYAEITIPSFRGMHSLKQMAQSVLDQAPENFSVVGHSLGGRVAFEIIHMAAHRVDKFAVMDTGVHPVQPGEKEKRQIILDIAHEQGMDALAQYWAPPMISPNHVDDKKLIEVIGDMVREFTAEECEKQVESSLTRKEQQKYLDKISHHVLLICGEEDCWSPLSQHQEMLMCLRSAELKVIADCGHMTTLEKPEEVNRILLEWLCSE